MGLFDIHLDLNGIVDAVGAGLKSAQDTVGNIVPDELVKSAGDVLGAGAAAVGDALGAGAAAVGDAVGGVLGGDQGEADEEASLRDLVALMWCLSTADGVVTGEERAKLAELAGSIDESYETYADEVERECAERISEAAGEFGQLAACKIEAQRILESMDLSERDSRLLCWNLLALANTDGLDDRETDFIRFVVRKANVDEATFEELRNYSDAIVEIERARKVLGTSDRSYSKIEPLMTEYAHREQIILGAAQALVCD